MAIYAVNGKEPVAAWIPSLDTAGNGTTTLTDLVGSNNGTLTNMDAATDWVADTDSGGVRALDFDGTDDYVNTGFTPSTAIGTLNSWAISIWIKQTSAKNNARIIANSVTTRWYLSTSTTVVFWGWGSTFSTSTNLTLSFGNWQHVVVTYNSTTGNILCFLAGSLVATNVYSGDGAFASNTTQIGNILESPIPFNGSIDDVRVFSTALDADDASYLYNSGNGRGRVVEPAPTGVTYHPLSSRSTHPLRFSI